MRAIVAGKGPRFRLEPFLLDRRLFQNGPDPSRDRRRWARRTPDSDDHSGTVPKRAKGRRYGGEVALEKLAAGGWLAPGALIVFERGSSEPPFSVPGFEPLDVRDYGAARVHFLRFEGA